MLVYHPAFDAYHCLFRSIAILEAYPKMEIDRLRILDFCLSFPTIITQFKLPAGLNSVKKAAISVANPYRDPISAKSVFINVAPIQSAAFSCLTATGLTTISSNLLARTDVILPESIKQRCLDLRKEEKVFFENILFVLMDLPLLGPNGLKARSGLMEYRYDNV
jgi:hypothetical protein